METTSMHLVTSRRGSTGHDFTATDPELAAEAGPEPELGKAAMKAASK
jgi:hypothetical protein